MISLRVACRAGKDFHSPSAMRAGVEGLVAPNQSRATHLRHDEIVIGALLGEQLGAASVDSKNSD
jgi:hypothetical protein